MNTEQLWNTRSFIIVVDGCIIIIHGGYHMRFYSVKQSWTLCCKSYCFVKDKSLFQGICYKMKQVFIRSSCYYYCEKRVCIRCTVTLLALESVVLCPLLCFVHDGIRQPHNPRKSLHLLQLRLHFFNWEVCC